MAIVDADAATVLLARAKDIVAVNPRRGEPEGALQDARRPWPFLRGDAIWRSRKAGFERYGRAPSQPMAIKAPKPSVPGRKLAPPPKPDYFSTTPGQAFDDVAGEHACRTWTIGDGNRAGDHHFLVRYALDGGEAISTATFELANSALVGLAALADRAVIFGRAFGADEETTLVVAYDGTIVGQHRRAAPRVAFDPVKWKHLVLDDRDRADDPAKWTVIDAETAAISHWTIRGELARIDEDLYALSENQIARVETDGRTVDASEIVALPGYPYAEVAARTLFRAHDRLGLVIGGDPRFVQWVDSRSLAPAGRSRPLDYDGHTIAHAVLAGDVLVTHDGRSAHAFRVADLAP